MTEKIKATREEMDRARIPLDRRDYCVDYYMNFLRCRNDHFPIVSRCHHEKHLHDNCEYQDYILRMKEYEREKRLMERQKRLSCH